MFMSTVAGRLCDGSGGSSGLNGGRWSGSSGGGIAVDLSLGAVTGDVTSLTASIAGLASIVKRATVRSSAIAGDVACCR